jgi:hypothetical protein
MANKPSLRIRPPPTVPDPAAAQRFIQGTEPSRTSTKKTPENVHKRPERHKRNGRVKREDGKVYRRMTIYLPPDLADRLVAWCQSQGRQISHATTEAISLFMKNRK